MNIKPHATSCPLVHLAVSLAAGISASHYISLPIVVATILGFVNLTLTVLTIRKSKQLTALITLQVAFFATGFALGLESQQTGPLRRYLLAHLNEMPKSVSLTGTLNRPPEVARDRVYLALRVESIAFANELHHLDGQISLMIPLNSRSHYDELQLRYGTRIRSSAQLTVVEQYRNPGGASLDDYLDATNLDCVGLIRDANRIERLGDVQVFTPLEWLYNWRSRIQRSIDSTFSAETAGVLDATLLGNRHNLPVDTVDRFRTGGTFHVLVISGFHISFIGGFIFLLVSRVFRNRLARFGLSSLVVWSYSIAVGGESSVVRAALMFSVVTFASVIFRRATSLNALGAAALTALISEPKALFDPSFQLTFLSVWAIVAIALPILKHLREVGEWIPSRNTPHPPRCTQLLITCCETIYWSEDKWRLEISRSVHSYRLFKCDWAVKLERLRVQRLVRYVFIALNVSIIVQLVLLPLLVIYFHRISPASLLLNLFVGVSLAVLSIVALLALLVSQLSASLAIPLIQLAELTNSLMIHSVDPFVHFGIASVRLPEYAGWKFSLYFLYYLPLLHLVWSIFRWRPFDPKRTPAPRAIIFSASAGLVLLASLIVGPSMLRADGRLHVDFLDVGQGDSALITMPDGTTILIDGGGRPAFIKKDEAPPVGSVFRIGEKVVSEFLWWRGLREIDYVLASHADADHLDGLNDVVRNFSVRSVLAGQHPENDPEFMIFEETLKESGTPLHLIQAGDTLLFGRVTVQVLWPQSTEGPSRNNDSVVLRIQFGERVLLFTGDIEKEAEQKLQTVGNELKADVVKVAHHGSRTSSTETFVRLVSPQLAVISVGRTSPFGHPHQEVVDRWQKVGAEVITTGRCGTIHVSTDGRDLTVVKFVE